MADNYLEKRMEDYRRGPRAKAPSRAAGPRAGRLVMPYPHQYVLVDGADTDAGRAAVEAFIAAGCTVAFTTGGDDTSGRLLAQAIGGRYYPGSAADALADMSSRGEPLGAAVHTSAAAGAIAGAYNIIIAPDAAPRPDALTIEAAPARVVSAARLAVIAACPGSPLPAQHLRL